MHSTQSLDRNEVEDPDVQRGMQLSNGTSVPAENIVMKGQVNVCRARLPHSNQTALSGSTRSLGRNEVSDPAPTLRRASFLALAGAAVVLLGCQQDPGGTAPGGLDPSPSSQQSEERDDTSPSGGPSGDSGPQSDTPESDAGGEDDPGDDGDAGGGAPGGGTTGGGTTGTTGGGTSGGSGSGSGSGGTN